MQDVKDPECPCNDNMPARANVKTYIRTNEITGLRRTKHVTTVVTQSVYNYICWLHCTLSLAAQCIVIGPVCGFVAVFVCGGGGCYHDNSKLHASIFTKLGL